MAPRLRLAVVCVDGATPRLAGSLFTGHPLNDRPRGPLQPLRSVYPSSTAPAHASMLTGVPPGAHGIVGNRYWENESAAEIRLRQDPLASLHPYCHASLRAPSLLDYFRLAGYRVGAVMFPFTFDLDARGGCPDALFCLYAPTEHLVVPLDRAPPGIAGPASRGTFSMRALGFDITFEVALDRRRSIATVRERSGGGSWTVSPSHPVDVVTAQDHRRLSFRLMMQPGGADGLRLSRTTAVAVLAFGDAQPLAATSGTAVAPHSRLPHYTAGGDLDFYEAPAAGWVTQAALRILAHADPEVLFVRYNQVDHAQEHLLWHARHGDPAVREQAEEQVRAAYREVGEQLAVILEALQPEIPLILFSDHGIDDAGTQVLPNVALGRLGMSDTFIFQGDANLAYLYGRRPLTGLEQARLLSSLEDAAPAVHPISRERLTAMDAYAVGRSGQLALQSARHVTFDYGEGDLVRGATIGAHGFDPALAEMDGIFQAFGARPWPPPPRSILELRDLVLSLVPAPDGDPDPWPTVVRSFTPAGRRPWSD